MKTTARVCSFLLALAAAFAATACTSGGASSSQAGHSNPPPAGGAQTTSPGRAPVRFDVSKVVDSAYRTSATLSNGMLTITVHDDNLAVHQLDELTEFQYSVQILTSSSDSKPVYLLYSRSTTGVVAMEDMDFQPNEELFANCAIAYDYDAKNIVFTANPKAGVDVKNAVFMGGLTVFTGASAAHTGADLGYCALKRDGVTAYPSLQTVEGGGLFSGGDGAHLKAMSSDYVVEKYEDSSGGYEKHNVVTVRSFDEYGFQNYVAMKLAFDTEDMAEYIYENSLKPGEAGFDFLVLDGPNIYYGLRKDSDASWTYRPWLHTNTGAEIYASLS